MFDPNALGTFYRRHLLDTIVPWWLRHAVDNEYGGLFTGIGDDGTIQTRNKYIWSNARALYTFTELCRRFGERPQWRDVADGLFRFLRDHGRDQDGHWVFLTTAAGDVIEGEKSIVVDSFGIFGMVSYFELTGDQQALDIALQTARAVEARLAEPGTYPTYPYPTPAGMKAQREHMQFSLAFCELGHAAGREAWLEKGLALGACVLDHFYRPDRQVLLEYINLDNTSRDTPAGRAMVPGHAIESLWFQMRNFGRVGDQARQQQAARAMRCACEKGWDPAYGGLFLGIDADGRQPVYWKNHEKKIWWVFTEAIPGLLMAHEQLAEPWCLEWFARVHDWAFSHFPNTEHGEWTQKLDRQGKPIDTLIALPVKDPFHLPRGLMMAIETLDRLASGD